MNKKQKERKKERKKDRKGKNVIMSGRKGRQKERK